MDYKSTNWLIDWLTDTAPSVLGWCIWNQQSDSYDMLRCTEQCHELETRQTASDGAFDNLEWQTDDILLQTATTDEHCDKVEHNIMHFYQWQHKKDA